MESLETLVSYKSQPVNHKLGGLVYWQYLVILTIYNTCPGNLHSLAVLDMIFTPNNLRS